MQNYNIFINNEKIDFKRSCISNPYRIISSQVVYGKEIGSKIPIPTYLEIEINNCKINFTPMKRYNISFETNGLKKETTISFVSKTRDVAKFLLENCNIANDIKSIFNI